MDLDQLAEALAALDMLPVSMSYQEQARFIYRHAGLDPDVVDFLVPPAGCAS